MRMEPIGRGRLGPSAHFGELSFLQLRWMRTVSPGFKTGHGENKSAGRGSWRRTVRRGVLLRGGPFVVGVGKYGLERRSP